MNAGIWEIVIPRLTRPENVHAFYRQTFTKGVSMKIPSPKQRRVIQTRINLCSVGFSQNWCGKNLTSCTPNSHRAASDSDSRRTARVRRRERMRKASHRLSASLRGAQISPLLNFLFQTCRNVLHRHNVSSSLRRVDDFQC